MKTCPIIQPQLQQKLRSLCPTLVLASQSPNRRQVLLDAGLTVIVRPQNIYEICGLNAPDEVVKSLSSKKCLSYLSSSDFNPQLPAIAVDTLVSLNGQLLGKPQGQAQAYQMLSQLSGKWHQVYSGLSVYNPKNQSTTVACAISDVLFKTLSPTDINWYISTGESLGAAGAYKIQQNGYHLISQIKGSYSNIIGIPLELLVDILS